MTLNQNINSLSDQTTSIPGKSRLMVQGNRQKNQNRQQSMLMRMVQDIESGHNTAL